MPGMQAAHRLGVQYKRFYGMDATSRILLDPIARAHGHTDMLDTAGGKYNGFNVLSPNAPVRTRPFAQGDSSFCTGQQQR